MVRMRKILLMNSKSIKSNSRPAFANLRRILSKSRRSQVWVETAVYTLIGLTLIAVIISMATPQIQKIKDKSVLEQTISAMNTLDNKILEVQQTENTRGKVIFKISKGKLEINSEDDTIRYVLEDTKLEASEPGVEIQERGGKIILKTEKAGARYNIILLMNYSLDITNKDGETEKILQAGATPYNIWIENKGSTIIAGATTQLEFEIA